MINSAFRRFGVRLALWYAAVFVISSIVILSVSISALHRFVERQDHQFVRAHIEDFTSHFDDIGFEGMLRDVKTELEPGLEPFFVRVADSANKTVFTNSEQYRRFDLSPIETPSQNGKWVKLRSGNAADTLDVFSSRLPDGHVLQIGKPSYQGNAPMKRFLLLSLEIAIPLILLGLAGGAVLSVKTFKPIRQLIATVRGITETGQMKARVATRGTRDELDELGFLFNLMLDRIERLVQGMQDALDNVAHDLRTPMTRLRNTAEEALEVEVLSEQHREALADCLEQSEEAVTMLKTLMDISEAETGTLRLKREPFDVSKLLEDAVDLYQHVAEDKGVFLRMAPAPGLTLVGDRYRLLQALANLLDNAIKYTPAGGNIFVEAIGAPSGTEIRVRDSGIGIPSHEISRIWDRLFRGERSQDQRGLGLGLSLVSAIARAHRGTATAFSHPGEPGVTITLTLPSSEHLSQL